MTLSSAAPVGTAAVSTQLRAPSTRDEIYVAGQWRRGSGAVIESVDPATGDVFATLHSATPGDVGAAVEGGLAAAAQSQWADQLPHERAAVLYRIGNAIDAHATEISALQTRNTGKTLTETRALASSAAATFRYIAAALETMEDEITPARGNYLSMSIHEPIGVIGAITPWNSPIASEAQKVAPALAAGNAVVSKPPVWAPWISLYLARLCDEAGLPRGLFSVLPGPGRTVGDALARHPKVGKITFTGGTSTGRTLGHVAADKIIPVTLELGGKSPTIVFADADMDQALAGVLYGIFSSSGQSCIAGSRVFIERAVYNEFVNRLVSAANELRVGPGTDPGTQVAPLITHSHRDHVASMVDDARSEGAVVLAGGYAPGGDLADGAYYRPTILAGVSNSARICQEEVFGPVAVVLPFEDEEDLARQANDSAFGLAAGIWTPDYRKAWRTARRIDAGTVWINTYKQFSISTPFSGTKESGLGTEKGRDGIRSYMRQKSIYLDLSGQPIPWSR
ncbi:aldehyde dehydrogenase [Hoyosella subflava]|uniref:Aldehyde dehydrogenase n=1 Tax=Hoyosella subflava (strain DSM 45089 / JCM 17490 / NBRC 109087 / DQS3-9A1) TaxID=443218 RepID=F6EFN1_HOYSD|nr:aldehyde dehydrogenase [Hoyosella subflava]AEF40960.1 Aldehyde dehydrogenase [Hoyosella subflava DQS3-9A1]